MKNYSIKELNQKYDLELDDLIKRIKREKLKLLLLQFPDGLKIYAKAIVDYLEEKCDSEFLIWFGSCFGACDTPNLGKELENKIDLVIQFGHNEILPSY